MARATRQRRTPWLRTHTDLIGHRKTVDLADMLEIETVHAVGHLVTFWHHVLIYEEDGDLTGCRPRNIANWAAWSGDPTLFFEAMVESGWLDRDGDRITVHDWMDYAGSLLGARERRERYRNAKRDSEHNETSQGRDKDVPRTSRGRPEDAKVQTLEKEKEKEEEKDTQRAHAREDGGQGPPMCVLTQEGQRLNDAYPEARRSSENATMVAIRKHIKPQGHTVDQAIERIEVWKRSDQWLRGIIPRLSKFFAEGTWLAEPIQARASPSRQRTPLDASLDFSSFEGLKDNV